MLKFLKNIIIFIRLISESLAFSLASIMANKVRTFLSLLGVTIGIFSIISMFTMIDSLERNISDSFSEIGNNVLYIQQWPWTGDEDTPWWKYRQRPPNKYEEFNYIQQNAQSISAVALTGYSSREVKYRSKVASNTYMLIATHDWIQMTSFEIEDGRYFSPVESQTGKNVAILGATVTEELFGGESPIGKDIKVGGRNMRVIGVLKKVGNDMFSFYEIDGDVVVPYNYAKSVVNTRNLWPNIIVKAKDGTSVEEMSDEMRRLIRAYRRLKPVQEDNFALNEMSMIAQIADQIFGIINLVGWIIGGFSILVGGFGIANIMFVSVKERTNIIGIQKALGAKKYFILIQFLFEAAFLAIMGGVIGLLLIWLGASLIGNLGSFAITLTLGNILLGLIISSVIGLLSGFIPALVASNLDPVVAINSK